MNAGTFDNGPRFFPRNFSRRDSFKNWPNAGHQMSLSTIEPVRNSQGENEEKPPHWEVIYTPDDARRDRIAFTIALTVALVTLALTNLGILR